MSKSATIPYTLFIKVDGNWGSWSPWSSCTKTCGDGLKTRTRLCDSPAPAYGGDTCPGDDSQSDECNNQPCKGKGNKSREIYIVYSQIEFDIQSTQENNL